MTELQTKLTQDQIDFYHANGYLELDTLTGHDEVQRVKVIYDRLFSEKAGRDIGDHYDLAGSDESGVKTRLPQIMNPVKYAPELALTAFRSHAFEIARQLLGAAAEVGDEHAIFKPAGDGAETPWHQDEAYWDSNFRYDALSIWMPLQEATLENGCLQFIPQSHQLEVLEHDSIGHDARVHGLQTDEADTSQAVACPMPAGGCTIHHCRTLHYAGANTSETPRRAYILTFRLPVTPRNTPRKFPWLERRQTARQQRVM
jgi:ectoine hydroxylase-related dioxygenase (phytanoyl-CoA dioxygenase family)